MLPTKDIITHKLILKLSDGPKTIMLTAEEAGIVRQHLNSADQFIVFRGEAYPKFGAELRFLTKEELETMREKCQFNVNKEAEEQKKKKDKERADKINKWIFENKDRYNEIYQKALIEVVSENSPFSPNVKACIAKGRSRKTVENLLKTS